MATIAYSGIDYTKKSDRSLYIRGGVFVYILVFTLIILIVHVLHTRV